MQDSGIAPPLRLSTRAASSHAPTGTIAGLLNSFHRLDRFRQMILAGLAVLALVIIAATTAYAFIPPGSDAAATRHATASVASESLVNSTAVAGQPIIAGHFVLSDISTNALTLDLHVFGANVTGTLTTQDCAGHPATAVVTGHFVSATTLVLTVAQPQVAHATTILYTITHTDEGFSLAWRDDAGQAQVQHWMTTTRALGDTVCQSAP
jgi:hypothetical protein